jgi:hypothetical protein
MTGWMDTATGDRTIIRDTTSETYGAADTGFVVL